MNRLILPALAVFSNVLLSISSTRARSWSLRLWRPVAASVALLSLGVALSAQTAEVYLGDDNHTPLDANSPPPQGRLPVLFVHGHNDNEQDTNFNYRQNWQEALRGLPSFKDALRLEENSGLGIEPYYIRFRDQSRSITVDAREIGDAIDRILHRHDPAYDYPHNPAQTTHVQVVIIAYSKGTISARQYLKSLETQVPGMPAPRPGFRPVSEFIAIAPPNHGIRARAFASTNSLSVKQLYNGYRPQGLLFNCGDSFNTPDATDYIQLLNGHPITDTLSLEPGESYESESPGSRADINPDNGAPNPPTAGTLYVTLFDALDRDFVGGDVASGDCQGRALALNLSPHAKNIPVDGITDDGWESIPSVLGIPNREERRAIAVHQNTPHTPQVICQALYTAVHHRPPTGQTCTLVDGKPVIAPPKRAAAMLTLDFSGSMAAPACPGCANTRAVVLKEAVELFVQLWSTVSVPSDRIGVTYFRTDVTPFAINAEPLPLLSNAATGVIEDVRAQTPGNATAMGGGLQRAIEALDGVSETPVRRVILFTDGMQNVNPMVLASGNQLVIDNEPNRRNSNVSPNAPPVALNSALGIAVDTIGIGAGEAFVGLLQNIADATGGRTWFTTAPDDDLRRFFVEQLVNALRGFSPQLVAYRRGAVAAGGSTESFAIEDGVRKLVLKVSWKSGDSLDFSVARDGTDVTSAGRFIEGAFYKIFVMDLPDKGRMNSRGNWQLRIKGKAATSYEAAAIVDGGRLKYDAKFDVGRPKAGDPLNLVVQLTSGGRPLTGSTRVTVNLTSPIIATGDIIATTRPTELPVHEPRMSVAEQQFLAFTQDAKRSSALKQRRQKMVLQPDDRGELRMQLHPQIPGIYTASVTIEGDDAQSGRFSRTLTATTVVRFASADPKASDIFMSECIVSGRRYVRLILSPRDARKYRMGPGMASAVSLRLSAGRIVGGTHDLGDGNYMISFEVAPGDDPTVNLDVAGGALFSGRLSQLSEKSKR
jgi:hypothetical protein